MVEVNNITELPLDILVLIFPHLDAKSFLTFCSTCKAFQQPSIRLDPAYWSLQARNVFRVPNQPVVQYDGDRWQKLYKRLFTQTRVYTWGTNRNNRLGLRSELNASRYPFPQEMQGAQNMGIIADLQCGGWSTTILNSKGTLYSVGVLDGERQWGSGAIDPRPLQFPAGYPESPAAASYEEPTITIRQFSAGRSHILGLSDSGRIWSWSDMNYPAVQIKFLNIDLKEDSTNSGLIDRSLHGTVKQVVAGWTISSAHVHGVGIVLWEQHRRPVAHPGTPRARSIPRRMHQPLRSEDEPDTMLMFHEIEIPKTGYQRPKGARRESELERALGEEVGQVENYIILEQFVVFVTDIGKVFCSKLSEKNNADNILELRTFQAPNGVTLDVQGSFRRFAIFKSGEVFIAEQDYLDACWHARISNPEQADIPGIKRIPALQHNNVVSVAFGDFHFLALHSTGKITAYGINFQRSGALGLGDESSGRLRGLELVGTDEKLLPHAYTRGRKVWFREAQLQWMEFLKRGGKDAEESSARLENFLHDRNVQGEVSGWIEQEADTWDEDKGEDGLGAFFALRVSAAGWHSGAVLLVNQELENKEPTYDWRNKSFPRLKLSNGEEMPGTVPFDEWREARPNCKLDEQL